MSTSQEKANCKSTSPVWLVRAGKRGEDEDSSLEHGLAILGFNEVGNLEGVADRDSVAKLVKEAHPNDTGPRNTNRTAQLTTFALRMRKGDVVALPLKTRSGQIALGRVTGDYSYQEIEGVDRHTRPVKWIRYNVPRTDFRQDLLYSLGSALTVCQIRRNGAEARIATILLGKSDPGIVKPEEQPVPGETDEEAVPDLAQLATERVIDYIRSRFTGHDLARLVEAVLRAEGYTTELSSPGPDGGADILAGKGPLAIEGPRLCVQVKATSSATDVNVLRSLVGTMQAFRANHGLLVSWGGFTGPLRREARQSFFSVRLWDANDLVNAIYRNYTRLPDKIQAEIPLERIWILVPSEGEV